MFLYVTKELNKSLTRKDKQASSRGPDNVHFSVSHAEKFRKNAGKFNS